MSQASPIIVFGEVLYDCFSDGRRVLGGAPFNVAWSLGGFGCTPLFISAVGDDADGAEIRKRMKLWGLSTRGLQIDSEHATGVVEVTIQDDEPSYDICAPRAWDTIQDEGYIATEFIYHGLLALRSETNRRTLEGLVERSAGKRFFDINLRPPYVSMNVLKKWIQGVNWLKLNIHELEELLGVEGINFSECAPYLDHLRETYSVENVLVTGGDQGAIIRGLAGYACCTPALVPKQMIDTVGAGDAFSACAIRGILSGMPVVEIVKQACLFASRVCAIQGATSMDQDFYRI
jgi:fructokinase